MGRVHPTPPPPHINSPGPPLTPPSLCTKGCLLLLLERCHCGDMEQVLELLQRLMPLMQLVQGQQAVTTKMSEEVSEEVRGHMG